MTKAAGCKGSVVLEQEGAKLTEEGEILKDQNICY